MDVFIEVVVYVSVFVAGWASRFAWYSVRKPKDKKDSPVQKEKDRLYIDKWLHTTTYCSDTKVKCAVCGKRLYDAREYFHSPLLDTYLCGSCRRSEGVKERMKAASILVFEDKYGEPYETDHTAVDLQQFDKELNRAKQHEQRENES